GYSCLAIHPATMGILDSFIATGSQIKTEMPTKGGVIAACDSIDGPIVKLKNGSVRKIKEMEEAKSLYDSVEEIIYIGDILIPYGDFANRNHILMPAGYTEQEWFQELKAREREKEEGAEIENIYEVGLDKAISLSKKFDLPLYPKYIFYWSQISLEEFLALIDWMAHSRFDKKIVLPWNKTEQERFQKGKRALELIGAVHEIVTENVLVGQEDSRALLANIGIGNDGKNFEKDMERAIEKVDNINLLKSANVLEIVNSMSEFKIRDKAGTFIGARMGRPEKAKLRKLIGSPNVLFPVGYEGGRLRSVNEAVNVGTVKADLPIYFCSKCNRETIYFRCEQCGEETKKMYFCPECKQKFFSETCPGHSRGQSYAQRKIDIKEYFNYAIKKLDLLPDEIPRLVKGVRGTSNEEHIPENLAKGILRSLFNLSVNKDGTIRLDATEMPITHFKPREISAPVEKLRELGYEKDIYGEELENEEQIVEIFPHDIIMPSCPDSIEEKSDEVFLRIANFIDALLLKFYGLKPFYNMRGREDLIGCMVSCIAPHNCASVVGRIIGFSKTQALLASPYMHAACRRDCDGDEIAVMLLLDLLINFSRKYLPAHRGSTQDAPLVLNAKIKAGEVDDMVFDVDIERELPLEMYEASREKKSPHFVKISQIRDRIGKQEFRDLWYEYEVSDINAGVLCSNYKKLASMQDKVERQMGLARKIRAVTTEDVARLVIDRHFIRDIRGNLRKFSQQIFRCSKCNEKYRRPPLVGKCLNCGGNIIFTISEGSIVKYLEPALALAEKFDVSPYIKQSLELTKSYIESIFGKEKEKQESIERWFS
ncbi:MAG: DNA polymerase II large subunit, partial [Nanoarchaeota archaeon]